jgi:hypothetical protein
MKIICSWCRQEGKAALVCEKAPLDDARETHGICVLHRHHVADIASHGFPLWSFNTMVFRAFPQMERRTERDQEDAPVGQAHLLADLSEDALVFIPETF